MASLDGTESLNDVGRIVAAMIEPKLDEDGSNTQTRLWKRVWNKVSLRYEANDPLFIEQVDEWLFNEGISVQVHTTRADKIGSEHNTVRVILFALIKVIATVTIPIGDHPLLGAVGHTKARALLCATVEAMGIDS